MKEKKQSQQKRSRKLPIFSGLITGFVNGFFGSGGGMIAVQTMEQNGFESKRAHATSILSILPLSMVSTAVYLIKGNLGFSANHWALLAGACAGGLLGAVLLGKLSAKWVDHLFTALMLISGLRMVFA